MQKFSKISVKVGTFVKQIKYKTISMSVCLFCKNGVSKQSHFFIRGICYSFVFFNISVNRCYQNTYYQYMYN